MCKDDNHNYGEKPIQIYNKETIEDFLYAMFICNKCGDVIERCIASYKTLITK